ncbi:MAG: glycosyltransferase [Selenomonadaceae bacterium]|nr:glycosyltransferase [Selenomonadaceae bacterium]
MKLHGTASFPTPEEAKRQRETVFPKKIKISILVPLYNTPQNFLKEMIDSVLAQTYENWELCLADGSDAQHADYFLWLTWWLPATAASAAGTAPAWQAA